MKTLPFIVITFATLFISCKGQTPTDQEKIADTSFSLGKVVSEMDSSIWQIFQDSKDNYWFGSNGSGVYFFDGKQLINYTTKDGLAGNQIRVIEEDEFGNIFIQAAAITKFDGEKFTTLIPKIPASPMSDSLENEWKFSPTDLWFNLDGEVYRYDGEALIKLKLSEKDLEKTFSNGVDGLPFKNQNSSPYSVFGIDKDKDGNIWLGTAQAGAFRYDNEAFLWFPEQELSTLEDGRVPGVRSMIQDKNGYYWLSNFISKYKVNEDGTGYEKLQGIAKKSGYFKDRLPYFNSGLVDNFGNLWMTTYTGGVWKYDGTTLSNYPIVNGGQEALLISIYSDNDNILWIGTDNAGVYKFNGKNFEKFEPFKK
ncbi:MAG: ligand-binding sensor domain-containing protein [Patiriisocius sp.]|uniref:ligand-binding sensor domain-containing protein n=1 Tax=Patiriisocius sp. TaxID=2822396 RepID=UPI003EF84C37